LFREREKVLAREIQIERAREMRVRETVRERALSRENKRKCVCVRVRDTERTKEQSKETILNLINFYTRL
jgi:hypothetical protein